MAGRRRGWRWWAVTALWALHRALWDVQRAWSWRVGCWYLRAFIRWFGAGADAAPRR